MQTLPTSTPRAQAILIAALELLQVREQVPDRDQLVAEGQPEVGKVVVPEPNADDHSPEPRRLRMVKVSQELIAAAEEAASREGDVQEIARELAARFGVLKWQDCVKDGASIQVGSLTLTVSSDAPPWSRKATRALDQYLTEQGRAG